VGTSKGYSQKSNGGAFGGTLMQTSDTTVGLAGGYLDSSVNTVTGSSRSSIDGFHVAAYGTYTFSGTVLTAAVTGAYQDQDVTRRVLVGGVVSEASGSPKAWLGGAGFGVAHPIPLEQGFTLTPRASLGWQHLERDGYTETGGGAAAYSLNQISTDTVRGQVGAELSLMVKDPNANWSVRPNIHGALAQEWRDGDANATGTFTATGLGFTAPLDNRDQTYLAVGAGVDVTVGHGITAFASYDGGFGGDEEKLDGLRFGARFEW
jgi:fibronectin-binding autotransporter adhesin